MVSVGFVYAAPNERYGRGKNNREFKWFLLFLLFSVALWAHGFQDIMFHINFMGHKVYFRRHLDANSAHIALAILQFY